VPNPYAPPSAEPPPSDASRRVWIALIPLFAAVVAGVILVALGSRPPPTPQAADWAFGASGVFLVFDVPVCVFVLAKWFLNGEPPDLFAELGIAQPREMRELFRQLKTRPKLDDDAFYETYFAGTSIPKNVPIKLRDALDETYDRDFRGVHPTDKVVFVEFDLDSDWDDVYDWLQSVFDMTISDEMRREELNGTFLSLVECVVDPRCREATEEAKRLAALQPPPTGYSRWSLRLLAD